MRLRELDIDVAIVQESKLKKTDKTPTLLGYASIRRDRPGKSAKVGLIFFYQAFVHF